jgi:catechol 2,3-dioxygenase-like lactoylglutathione lyase family enzyme
MADKPFTMKLELVPLPVSDVDRAKAFYVDKIGFHADHDVEPTPGMRIVQLTPPGSACSILLSTGMGDITAMKPGSHKGLHLVVTDVEFARAHLRHNNVDVSEIQDTGDGIRYAYFHDPDGNSWELQEINLKPT